MAEFLSELTYAGPVWYIIGIKHAVNSVDIIRLVSMLSCGER